MIRLVANWRAVLRHAWSLRLMALAAVLSGIEVALPLLDGVLPIPPLWFAGAEGLITMAAMAARFVAQAPISGGKDGQPPEKE